MAEVVEGLSQSRTAITAGGNNSAIVVAMIVPKGSLVFVVEVGISLDIVIVLFLVEVQRFD
jgi:hypothetical protein